MKNADYRVYYLKEVYKNGKVVKAKMELLVTDTEHDAVRACTILNELAERHHSPYKAHYEEV